MKIAFIFPFLLTICMSCSKERKVEQLPPETQTGAGTLGFKINNRVYKTDYPYCRAAYQHLRPPAGDGSFLTIIADVNRENWNCIIQTERVKVYTGGIYPLNNKFFVPGTAAAKFTNRTEHYTMPELQGELRITRQDSVRNIISGTFWFDAKDTAGNVIQVREGRFDLRYTE